MNDAQSGGRTGREAEEASIAANGTSTARPEGVTGERPTNCNAGVTCAGDIGFMADGSTTTFTPVFDAIIPIVGFRAAIVYGRMWRYAQMAEQVCRVGLRRLALDLQMGHTTVEQCIDELLRAGLLIDETPDRIKSAHRYTVVDVNCACISTDCAQVSTDEDKPSVLSQAHDCPKVSTDEAESVPNQAHKIHTKRHSKKQLSGESAKQQKTDEPEVPTQQVVIEFEKLVGYPLKAQWGMEAKAAKGLLKAGYDPPDIFGCWAYLQTDEFWQGKHCSLASVAKQIGPWIKAGRPAARNGNGSAQGSGRTTQWSDPHHENDEFYARCQRQREERERQRSSAGG
jgi:hypothetical protein